MTDTLTRTDQLVLNWYTDHSPVPLGADTVSGIDMTADQAAAVIREWGYSKRNARATDPYTVIATTVDGTGRETIWRGRLPELAEKHPKVSALLDEWADRPLSVEQHRLLGMILRLLTDGLPADEALNELLATAKVDS
ncbi:hypothetical protein [Kineosporia sp. NBRC 101731]|uniref:hypothetical protein n=1 Tax=Kineosporia sp. NBRC 101731 TaxID=3032199 RepID=UPI0024A2CAAD|nr:hypothetical protein [Kineosporia sp. NBRC 101731]GLY32025.1 hypothetical protein Kisp02_53900 [Kineosporia sp. NBRC 101731]